jgi:predicted  nucleic acid-binding Zn-ribbon protein
MKTQIYEKETEDLETHVSICHERYLQLEARLVKLEEDVSTLRADIAMGNKSVKNTVITTSGTIIVALIGVLTAIILKAI